MSTVTADPVVQQWLAQFAEVTEIRDAQGNLLGLFTPGDCMVRVIPVKGVD